MLMAAPGRLAKLAWRVARSNLAEPAFPYRLTYAVTSRCQARCVMCDIWQKPAHDELSLAEIDAFFAGAKRFSWINLTGGELFQRPDIVDIIRTITRHCRDLYLLNFPTNGYQTAEVVAAVDEILHRMDVPRLMVTVSVDGPRDMHDRIRNLPGAFDRALATFRALRERRSRRFSVFLGYTLQEANLAALPATVDACRQELGAFTIDDLHVNLAHVSGHYYANTRFAGLPDAAGAGRLLAGVAAVRKRGILDPVAFLEDRYQRLAQTYLATGAVPLTCQAAAASCFIDPCGTIYPCSGFAAPIGTVRECGGEFYRLWSGADRQRTRQAVCSGACPGCWTPCEAYQTILAHLPQVATRRGR
jgi:MoaA/NifB/PqqE/SkfB family radical SAM enzyme